MANSKAGRERPDRIGRASVSYAPARDILTRATGFVEEYDFTLNPYSGCSFGCSYCYAAFFGPTEEERDSWGEWVRVKENAVELLINKLDGRRKDGRGGWESNGRSLIYMSSVTDPYQPIERRLGLTRALLEVLADADDGRFGRMAPLFDMGGDDRRRQPRLVVQTRSPDVTRDVDLFRRIIENGGRVQVNMTVTTDDEDVRRAFEPSCPSNATRLEAVADVRAAGVPACVTMTPLLLVSDPGAFVESLLDTGVRRFIVQPFHFARGNFVAGTRQGALEIMSAKLGFSRGSFERVYMDHYGGVARVLRERLPNLGEGKAGFAPPF